MPPTSKAALTLPLWVILTISFPCIVGSTTEGDPVDPAYSAPASAQTSFLGALDNAVTWRQDQVAAPFHVREPPQPRQHGPPQGHHYPGGAANHNAGEERECQYLCQIIVRVDSAGDNEAMLTRLHDAAAGRSVQHTQVQRCPLSLENFAAQRDSNYLIVNVESVVLHVFTI